MSRQVAQYNLQKDEIQNARPKTFLAKLKLGFGLLQHSRQSTVNASATAQQENIPVAESPVLAELLTVNRTLEEKYLRLRQGGITRYDEAACVDAIKQLELARLNLLSKLNGQDLNGYAKRPLEIH